MKTTLIYIINPRNGAVIESTRTSNPFAYRAARLGYMKKYETFQIKEVS